MNKDVDERLVPKGEYRDAMNIQVSTSEGSDVGAVQNILGNMKLTDLYVIPFASRCVGAIADEKNNCFYWFVQHKDKDVILKYHNGNVTPVVVDLFPNDSKKRILNFPKVITKKLITGINIIDDLLFWTDGVSEPKKINVTLCQQGTDVTSSYHTRLIVPKNNITINDNILLKEEHITVVKKYPLTPLILEPKYTKSITSEIISQNPFHDGSGNLLPTGDVVIADFDNFINGSGYNVNEELLLLNTNGQLPENFDVKVKVVEDISGSSGINIGNPNGYSNVYKIEILYINPSLTTGNSGGLMFKAQSVSKEEIIFEKKFPRFSYRWRYQDGEYSTFAPFTSTVFGPGKFSYDTKSAFNKGMDKYLVGLNLRNFLPINTPEDVVQVDILYKEADSTTVYIVDTVKPNDRESISIGNAEESYVAENFNNPNFNLFGNHMLSCWDANSYELESDVIFAATPENQLLRPWDNVPRFAKAQEMSANRIVYGNYTQNFDVLDKPVLQSKYITRYPDNIKYNPLFFNNYTDTYLLQEEDISPGSNLYLYGQKSLKSMRDYQVGVTFMDKYGRETPVFSDAKSTFQIKKKHGKGKLAIQTRLKTDPPYWAEYMKFYVKETSSEYYNLAMDRIYDAKDGHFWLSFPSSEINKVREDDYLILKKGENTNSMITEEAKYKVIDISKTAPDYIKTKIISVGSSAGSESPALTQGSPIVISQRFFEIDEDTWIGGGNAKLDTISEKLSLDFSTTTQTSKEYDIVAVDVLENGGVNGGRSYKITLDRIVDLEDQWIYPNYPTIISGSLPDLDPSLQISVYKNIKENRPEFDGKFFVKIYGDGVVNQYLLSSNGETQYQVEARIDAYFFLDGHATADMLGSSGYSTTGFDKSNSISDWESNFDVSNPSDNIEDRVWFLDNAYYKGTLPLNFGTDDDLSDETTSGAYGQGIHQLSDGKWYMDISYGQIHKNVWYGDHRSTGVLPQNGTHLPWDGNDDDDNIAINSNLVNALKDADKLWGVGNPINSHDAIQATLVSKLVEGSKFRFAGDTSGEIFEITNVSIKRLFNHTLWFHVEQEFDAWGDEDYDLGDNWEGDEYVQFKTRLAAYGKANNRRLRYKIQLDKNPNLATIKPYTNTNTTTFTVADDNTPFGIEFVDEKFVRGESSVSMNPAIWETEPKQSEGLDIYHEASQAYPVRITPENSELYIPVNSVVTRPGGEDAMQVGVATRVSQVQGFNGTSEISLQFNEEISLAMANINPNVPFRFTKIDGSFVTLYLADLPTGPLPHFTGSPPYTYEFKTSIKNNPIGLDWFNCFSFGNGVESNRIRDDFNQKIIDKGPIVSSTIDSNYETETRTSGLIFSGIYNSTTGVNNLNQFIMSEGIIKDLNPFYGSIQKLFSRNNDLLAFCEDKVLKILANKDAVFNADGNPQLLSTDRVLGQTIPFAGDYGISKNPESFAADAFRVYFTDKARSAVLRLSMDGITVISDYGMSDWFSDNLKNNNYLIGSFDTDKGDYNLTLVDSATTISFDDKVNGWSSFKSFVTEHGALSLGSDYFTFNNGLGYKHHVEVDRQGNKNPRNTFYDIYTPSHVSVVLNDEPSVIKSFKTISYEGSQSYINQETTDVRTGFYNLTQKDGWSTEYITTDKQKGNVSEFIEKEGKWFNYIKGIDVAESLDIKTDEFSFQGIGKITNISVDPRLYHITPPVAINGCMDPTASNYNPNATQDDGSCTYIQQIPGCTDPNANNYNPLATYDDGSCVIDILGCTDPRASNYNPNATVDDGSCFLTPIYGCTNPNATNYDSTATVDDGSCILPPNSLTIQDGNDTDTVVTYPNV